MCQPSDESALRSIAIAGAWGYIGRKFLEAAQGLGWETSVHDPGPLPADLDLRGVTQVRAAEEFYSRQADLFHLALHPEQRRTGMDILLRRGRDEPIRVLCEKPMAEPHRAGECRDTIAASERSSAVVLYDFPELFDPITQRIVDYLAGYREVAIDSIEVQRSKDREDPANPRNYKRMVPIQYQESVHCLTFVLYLLASTQGDVGAVLSSGLAVDAQAQLYAAPNPEDYPHPVDGRCVYRLRLGRVAVAGTTDFKRGAAWAKRRLIRGRGDGRSFEIEADFLESRKRLVIDGQAHHDVTATNSYAEVLKTFSAWSLQVPRTTLLSGLYPHPRFAYVTYQLSSALWHASQTGRTVAFDSLDELLEWEK